jgi:hypothetical protein
MLKTLSFRYCAPFCFAVPLHPVNRLRFWRRLGIAQASLALLSACTELSLANKADVFGITNQFNNNKNEKDSDFYGSSFGAAPRVHFMF